MHSKAAAVPMALCAVLRPANKVVLVWRLSAHLNSRGGVAAKTRGQTKAKEPHRCLSPLQSSYSCAMTSVM
jgi:hypothetical protein